MNGERIKKRIEGMGGDSQKFLKYIASEEKKMKSRKENWYRGLFTKETLNRIEEKY